MKVRVVPIEPHRDQIEAAYTLIEDMPPRKAKELCRQIYRAMLEHTPQVKRGGLTKNQRRVHEIITETVDATGVAPTYREIARMLAFKDHSSVYAIAGQLVRKGILFRGPGHRDIKIVIRPEQT